MTANDTALVTNLSAARDTLPPLPWSYVTINARDGAGNAFVYLLDVNGRKIGSLWGKRTEKIAMAEFICAAADKLHEGSARDDRE